MAAFLVNAPISASPWAATATAAGNTLAPLVAAALLRRVGFRRELDRLRDAIAIVFLGGLSATLISASVGAGTLALSGAIPAGEVLSAWVVWWTGDATGVLFVAPFLLSLLLVHEQPLASWTRRGEAGAVLLLVGTVSVAATRAGLGLMFLVFPMLGWAAWRFQLRGAAPAALLVAGSATWAAAHGLGPFEGGSLLATMLTLQAFNAAVAITSLVFAAVVAERMLASEDVERAAARLEDRVRDRTLELSAANALLRREEQALRQSEERFRGLLESAPDGVVVIDARGRIALVNEQTEQIFGYSRDELLGKQVEVLVPERFRTSHPSSRTRYFAEAKTRPMGLGLELGGRRKDGSEFPVDISLASLETGQGRLAMAFVRDVTSRKQAEDALRQTVEILRSTDQERRHLLSRLVTAQEEERRRVASDVHDDTIQAMTAVGIRLSTLTKVMGDREEAGRLMALQEAVQAAIARLRRLVFQLRPPALDRNGVIPALRVALDDATTDFEGSFNLEDRLVGETPAEVQATIYRIAQEAIANVRKHSGARAIRVVAETREGGVFMRIQDDGRGFSATPTATPEPGHLGLMTMRERAELAGGWFRVRSSPGNGTAVEFWLPVDPARVP